MQKASVTGMDGQICLAGNRRLLIITVPITDCARNNFQSPISDCHLVPITDYRRGKRTEFCQLVPFPFFRNILKLLKWRSGLYAGILNRRVPDSNSRQILPTGGSHLGRSFPINISSVTSAQFIYPS
jgi:hypothetical protein